MAERLGRIAMTIGTQSLSGMSPEELSQQFSLEELMELRQQVRQRKISQPSTPLEEGAGGITPYDPEQDFFSSENISAMGSNIIPSAVNMGSDLWDLATSPIESAKAIGEAGVGGIVSALGERFGGLENIKRTAVEDPFGLALDVAPGLGVASKFSKAAAAASKVASPVKAATGAVAKLGKGVGELSKAAASAASGIDPGILTTARKVRGATPQSAARSLRESEPVDWPGNVDPVEFVKAQREGFDVGFSGKGAEELQSGIGRVSEGITEELQRIATEGMQKFGGVAIDDKSYRTALNKMAGNLREKSVILQSGNRFIRSGTGEMIEVPNLNFRKSTIPDDGSAHDRISIAAKYIVDPLENKLGITIDDVWLARKRIDEMAGNALKQKYGDMESTILKGMRGDLNDFLTSVPNEAFQKFNADYASMSSVREAFDQMIAGKIDPDNQIAAMVRSIKAGRELSEAFITRVEATTGVPLRAIAAGRELSGFLPRGLVGRGIFAGALGAAVGPEVLIGFFIAPPKLIGTYLKGIGVAERTIRRVGEAVEQVMSLPAARELAEQGLTMGLILKQLEGENKQPSLMGRVGQAQSGQAEPPPPPSLGASETSVPEETFGLPRLQQYQPIIDRHSQFNQIPSEFIEAVIQAESGGDPNAESRAGAVGLMQLMPVHNVGDRRDPEQNIAAGAKYLKELIDEFGSMERALWAYNAGPAAARAGRMPEETKKYIPKVMAIYSRLGGLN